MASNPYALEQSECKRVEFPLSTTYFFYALHIPSSQITLGNFFYGSDHQFAYAFSFENYSKCQRQSFSSTSLPNGIFIGLSYQ
uniref:Uncharacterized protein n=1 Tax=Octopus bimaculoides TaxID=37653 RepID=A0A0L8IDR3_OCTBM